MKILRVCTGGEIQYAKNNPTDMPTAKHKEKVKETSDVLKGSREVLHDGSNAIVAQMVAFMNRVDGEIKTNRNTGK